MMREIIDYKILWNEDTDVITKEINQAIREGWQPYGSLVIERTVLIQAMVVYRVL